MGESGAAAHGALLVGLSARGFELAAGAPFDTWRETLALVLRLHEGIQWAVGDLLNFGEAAYGEAYAQGVPNVAPHTLAVWKYVANRFAPARRGLMERGLTWAHFAAVAGVKDIATQDEWLERARDQGWSSHALREVRRDEELEAEAPRQLEGPGDAIVPPADRPDHGDDLAALWVAINEYVDAVNDFDERDEDSATNVEVTAAAVDAAVRELLTAARQGKAVA